MKKLQFTRKGVVVREVSSASSLASRKRSAFEVTQKLKRQKPSTTKETIENVVESDNDSDGTNT